MIRKILFVFLSALIVLTSCTLPEETLIEPDEGGSYVDGPPSGRKIFPLGYIRNTGVGVNEYGYLVVDWGVEIVDGNARTCVEVTGVLSYANEDAFRYPQGYFMGYVNMDLVSVRVDDTCGGSVSQDFENPGGGTLTVKGPFRPLSDNVEPNYLVVSATTPPSSKYASVPTTVLLDTRPRLKVFAGAVNEGSVSPSGNAIYSGAEPIPITAAPQSGYRFLKWNLTSNSEATILDSFSASTTVTIRKGSGSVQALFVPSSESGTIGPLSYRYCMNYASVYNDGGTGAYNDVTVYRPVAEPGYYPVGYYAQGNYLPAIGSVITLQGDIGEGQPLAHPEDYQQIWNDHGTNGNHDGAFWKPIAPAGYVALGYVVTGNYLKPALTAVVCVRSDLVVQGRIGSQIWNDSGSGSSNDVSLWGIVPNDDGMNSGCFFAHGSHSTPTSTVYVLRK